MTLTKASIIEMVAAENGWTQKQSSEYVDLLLEIMKRTLASGEDLILPPMKVVTFKCSGRLRDYINKV